MGHHLWMLLLRGETHLAPLKEENLESALDLGCGTGIWAIDFGDTYPDANVVGIDLSPIQPSWVPPNVSFLVDDIEDTWTTPPNSQSYIHGRALVGSVKDWNKFAGQIYEALTPGGYVEFQEADMSGQHTEDGSALPGGAFAAYKAKIAQASQAFGTHLDTTPELAGILRKAGFVDVVERKIKTPIGAWPRDPRQKEIGRWVNALNDGSLEAYGLALFTRVLQMGEKEAKDAIDAAVKELKDTRIRWYYYSYVVYGRKPEVLEKVPAGEAEKEVEV